MNADEIIRLWKDIVYVYVNREGLSSEATRRTYQMVAEEWLQIVANKEKGQVIHPADVNAMHVGKFVSKKVKRRLSKVLSTRRPSGRGKATPTTTASPSYMQLRLSVLVGLFDEAILRDICQRNIAREYQRTHRPKRLIRKLRRNALTREQWNAFLEQLRKSAKNPHILARNEAIFHLLLHSGLRVHELVAMRLGDIDWKRKEIDVIGKGGKDQPVILTKVAERYLRDWIDNHRPFLLKDKESDYVWISQLGKPLSIAQVQKLCRKTMMAAGINKQMSGPHTFRHTFVTWAIDSGADLNDVAVAARHNNITTTRHYYSADEEAIRRRVRSVFE